MPELTIGQLAAHAGVTVRAVRHYHQRGLLAEPERDGSGYRRYGAQAVVDLIRIKTLSDAGVPLARIEALLSAGAGEFADAITQIDEALEKKIRELTHHRRRIAELAGGERLFLPAEIVDLLDDLREMGVSERTVRLERDGWILVVALSPDLAMGWANGKKAAMADPDFRRLYLVCDEALDWDPADPRLAKLAGVMADWTAQRDHDTGQPSGERAAGDSVVFTLMNSQVARSSPAWQRLAELSRDLMRDRG